MYFLNVFRVSFSGATTYGVCPFLSLKKKFYLELNDQSGHLKTYSCRPFLLLLIGYYSDPECAYLLAGSLPASINSLMTDFCPAADATCSKVKPAESMGLLRRHETPEVGFSSVFLFAPSFSSSWSSGSCRRERNDWMSPVLQAV